MKFNWGTGAFLLFGSFAIFMIGLAIYASQQTNELVTEDYYEKELEFKDVLVKQEKTNLLSEQLSWKIENNSFIVHFPEEIKNTISGKIIFFKPSSQKDDKEIAFSISENVYKLDLSNFSKGMYKVKIDWNANATEYYNEEEVVIP